ncbi:MAG: thermonuclease family protein [Alphaproteobacteria bacterium]|nr:thermonuclease family protein [Alphaproteobacteria bacterium]
MKQTKMHASGVLALIFVASLTMIPSADAETLTGRARTTSGDTLTLERDTVRLLGIDAPELDQYCENDYGQPFECGRQALDALRELIGRATVTCLGTTRDEEGRLLAICYAGDLNLNSRMARNGWAVARSNESQDYVHMARLAKREKAGIWALKFTDPAEWRAQNK